MNIDSIRQYCLSFPGATENLQWGDDLCFKVAAKLFTVLSLHSVPPKLCFKCTPEKFAELCEIEGIGPAPYVGRYKWILLENSNVVSSNELDALIRRSYGLVVAKAPKRKTRREKTASHPRKK